jgi:hypothetical protein
VPASARVCAVLQHAKQSCLRFERHVADLIEEQRAPFRLLEAPGAIPRAEQFALDRVFAGCSHVDGYERTVAALAVVVQRMRD